MRSATRVTKRAGPVEPLAPAVPPFPVHRFTVDEYHQLIENGILTAGHRFELIHGWLVTKMTLNPPHNYAVTALMNELMALVGRSGVVRVQQPVTTADSEPEPDVVLAAGSNADYKTRNPRPSEVVIAVEVADSSLRQDQTTKLELYAGAKIGAYWIVNLVDRRVEVYTQPRGGKSPTYKQHTNYGPDDTVPVVIGGKPIGSIAVKELLP